jgi:hypothetical protein
MRAALTGFRESVAQLRQHLEGIGLEWELVASARSPEHCSPRDLVAYRLQEHVGAGVWKRIFDYNSTIISLYGSLERYVDELIRGYLRRASAVVAKYGDLPDALRGTHLQGTLTLINRVEQRRFRGTLSIESLVSNLHSCLSGMSPYRLNLEAFVLRAANYRAEVIAEAFRKIGVADVLKRLPLHDPLAAYFADKYQGEIPASATSSDLYYYLDDLTERRNDVSHGTVSELLSADLLGEYLNFIEKCAEALFELVYSESMVYEIPHRAVELGNPIQIFNDSIVCFGLENVRVTVGDELVARTTDPLRPFKVGPIVEIQVENQSVETVDAQSLTKVALRIEYKAKPKNTFALLQASSHTRDEVLGAT